MKRISATLALGAGAVLLMGGQPAAAQGTVNFNGFQAGNLVVTLDGQGLSPIANDSPTPITLQQYTTGGTFVSSLQLPTTASGANRGIVTSGFSKSEGALNLSGDGHSLTFFGYDAAQFTSPATKNDTATTQTNRVIALIGANGSINTTTALTDAYNSDNPRSAVTQDGTRFYTGGNGSKSEAGIRTATLGATTSTQIETNQQKNIRVVEIYNGQLYASVGVKNTGNGIFQVGTGLPTTGGQTLTQIIGPQVNGQFVDPVGFFFADPNTLYVADDGVLTSGETTGLGGLQKYTATNGVFSFDYALQTGLGTSQGLRGLTGQVGPNGVVSLFGITAETGEGDPTKLVSFSDSLGATTLAAGATFTTLQTSPTNTVFRGIAFSPSAAPVPEASTVISFGALLALGGLVLLRRRQTAR